MLESADNDTAAPFFQYFARVNPLFCVSYPATKTSFPEIAIAAANALFAPSVSAIRLPFFQYTATWMFAALYSHPATYTFVPDTAMQVASELFSLRETSESFFQYTAFPFTYPAT